MIVNFVKTTGINFWNLAIDFNLILHHIKIFSYIENTIKSLKTDDYKLKISTVVFFFL